MDFLNLVKKRLEEMEQQARMLQAIEDAIPKAAQQSRAGKGRGSSGGSRKGGKGKGGKGKGEARTSLVSQEESFQTPSCPSQQVARAEPVPSTGAPPALRPRLVDDLQGRLDEAFLLSEILGPPRCVRGWEE